MMVGRWNSGDCVRLTVARRTCVEGTQDLEIGRALATFRPDAWQVDGGNRSRPHFQHKAAASATSQTWETVAEN